MKKLYILNDLLPVPEYEEASDEDIIDHPAVVRHMIESAEEDNKRLRDLLARFTRIYEDVSDATSSLDSAVGDLYNIVEE